MTDRTLAGLRLILSLSALLIVLVDPTEPNNLQNVASYALIGYICYSMLVYAFARRYVSFSFRTMQYIVWIDVLWYSVLITLSRETNAVFFFFYLFAIITGSSRGGTRLGLTLTAVCTAIFLLLNLLLVTQLQLDIPRMARRTVYMAVLGYILAYWGGAEAVLRGRLTLLKELLMLSNPRFGVDRTIFYTLRRLREFFNADYCFLVIGNSGLELTYYRITRNTSSLEEVSPTKVQGGTGIPLIDAYDATVAVYAERVSSWNKRSSYRSYDSTTQTLKELPVESAADIAEALNVRSFVIAPLQFRDCVRGRVLVGSVDPSFFKAEDATFLQQAANQVLPLVENIRIVDHLASDAAGEERRRIARSVHDRVIQPYLGLQLGLKALRLELSPGKATRPSNMGLPMLDELLGMTRDGIDELREYVSELKTSRADPTSLTDAIRRFAANFQRSTGIRVEIFDNSGGMTMNDRLAAELFQMTAEALSNVHRHTQSRNAEVRLDLSHNNLELTVVNDVEAGREAAPFKPRSIFERAEALGAHPEIVLLDDQTLVRVEVPL